MKLADCIYECLADLAHATRHDKRIALGTSTQSLVLAIPALQVWAMLNGRDFVSPQDVKSLAVPLFSHRVEPAPGVTDIDGVISELTATVVERHTRNTLAK